MGLHAVESIKPAPALACVFAWGGNALNLALFMASVWIDRSVAVVGFDMAHLPPNSSC